MVFVLLCDKYSRGVGGIKTTQHSSRIREETQEIDIMTPGERQYDIETIIVRQ